MSKKDLYFDFLYMYQSSQSNIFKASSENLLKQSEHLLKHQVRIGLDFFLCDPNIFLYHSFIL